MKRYFAVLIGLSLCGALAFADSTDVRIDPAKVPLRSLSPEEVITAEELRARQLTQEPFMLLDARDRESYEESHIFGAVLPLPAEYYRELDLYRRRILKSSPDMDSALAESMKSYDRDGLVVTYCNADCKASTALLLMLKSLGFRNVRAMEEGIQSWEAKGYPVIIGVPRLRKAV